MKVLREEISKRRILEGIIASAIGGIIASIFTGILSSFETIETPLVVGIVLFGIIFIFSLIFIRYKDARAVQEGESENLERNLISLYRVISGKYAYSIEKIILLSNNIGIENFRMYLLLELTISNDYVKMENDDWLATFSKAPAIMKNYSRYNQKSKKIDVSKEFYKYLKRKIKLYQRELRDNN